MIICCGEALMDMLPRSFEDGRTAYLPTPGGAIFNTAIALGRLEEKTAFFSGLSTDAFGKQLITQLEDSGVSTVYCVRSPNPTTLAFITLEDGIAQYNFLDENSAIRTLTIDALPSFPPSVRALHFGAISLIPESCGAVFEELTQRMREKAVISLDPNIRPGFITDEPAYRKRLCHMIAMSDIIKISEEDLDWIEPGGRFEHVAQNWIDGGASVVTLTKGEEGSRSITRRDDIVVPAAPAKVVDTVGAGDAYNAGFLSSLRASGTLSKAGIRKIDQNTLRLAIDFGSRVAAYTVARAGANPPWRKDLEPMQ